MTSLVPRSHAPSKSIASAVAESMEVPWMQLEARISAALIRHKYYIASSEDLSLLWHGERIDAVERRRRITVFAAQHQWHVDARADGAAARFQIAPASGFYSREVLSRTHE
jgi:hypothetical protein